MKWKIEEEKVRNGSILETDKERDELVAGKIRRASGEGRRVTGVPFARCHGNMRTRNETALL